jgi:hypothetical protein
MAPSGYVLDDRRAEENPIFVVISAYEATHFLPYCHSKSGCTVVPTRKRWVCVSRLSQALIEKRIR